MSSHWIFAPLSSQDMLSMLGTRQVDEEEPLLDMPSDEQERENGQAAVTLTAANKILACLYGLFLVWQLVGMVVYVIRTIACCYAEKQASFQCKGSRILNHSEYVQLAWLGSQIANSIICFAAFRKFPNFPGYTKTLKKLAGLPKFWSLVFLLVITLSGYAVILYLNDVFPMQNALIIAFAGHCTCIVVIVGFTNFLSMTSLRLAYPRYVFNLIKLTTIVYFLQNFALFFVGSIQLPFDVNGLDSIADTSANFRKTFGILRRFSVVVFHLRIGTFFWKKLWIPDKIILGNHFHH